MSYKRSSLMQERMEQNRKSILSSARKIISEGGFKDAQIQTIAEQAGVSSGLVYRYFDNKSQVLIEVLSDAINTELLVIESITESDLSAKQKLHKAVATVVKRALNSPQLAYSLMFEHVDSTVEQSIKKILADGNASGEFVLDDLNTAALCVVGAMTYVVVEPLDPAQNTKFDHAHKDYFSKQIADFCVDAVQKK